MKTGLHGGRCSCVMLTVGGGAAARASSTTSSASSSTTSRGRARRTSRSGSAFADPELTRSRTWSKEFETKHPGDPRQGVGGINDDKIIAAIRGGKAPDVAQSFTSDNTGAYCRSRRLDRPQALHADATGSTDIDLPGGVRAYYTQFNGKRCALPMLADAYGLYYNKDTVQEGGPHGPPQDDLGADRVREEADAANSDGSLKVVGLQPVHRLVRERPGALRPRCSARSGSTATASRHSSTTPAWAKLLQLAEEPHRLVRLRQPRQSFQAGAGDEFSASNAFENGKLAMNIDGEWRVAFIATSTRSSSTARRRARSTTPSRTCYGAGYITGTIIGIPKSARSTRTQAWALVKYLTTEHRRPGAALERAAQRADDHGVAEVAGPQAGPQLRDVPEDLRQPEHDDDADHGGRSARTRSCSRAFVAKWQAGHVERPRRPG